MTKIMLVEDDKSLREIYGVRLLAEGYDIVSAGDGEQALAVAIKERPALIITDLMMPKISGFDMLDILRSTTETRNIKVIVMTALGSDEQRMRGEQLGADRYLVKSQVGIEDVVRTVHEVLNDQPSTQQPQTPAAPAIATVTPPVAPAANRAPAPNLPRPIAPNPIQAPPRTPTPVPPPASPPQPAVAQRPVAPFLPPTPASTTPTIKNRVIQPLSDSNSRIDINELLDKELAKEAGIDLQNRPAIASTQQEKALVQNQLQGFTPPTPAASIPTAPQSPTTLAPPAANTQVPTQPIQPATNPTPQPTIQIGSDGKVIMPDDVPPPGNVPPPPPPVVR